MNLKLLCSILFVLFGMYGFSQESYTISLGMDLADGNSSSFEDVKGGDTVFFESGTRDHLLIRNFEGSEGNPIVFIPRNGKLIIDTDFHYGLNFRNCKYFIVTGKIDDRGTYGIEIQGADISSAVGLSVGSGSTDFEASYFEISGCGFAGIMTKTEPGCSSLDYLRDSFTQKNTIIHNMYIHDVAGEGMYVGSSKYSGQYLSACDTTVYPPVLEGVRIYDNLVMNTGFDGLQISSASEDCEIYGNTVINDSYREVWAQMSGIIMGGGSKCSCYNNLIKDGRGTGILMFGFGDSKVFNNLIINPGLTYQPENPEIKEHGIFVSQKTIDQPSNYHIYNNTIISPRANGIRFDSNIEHELKIKNNAIIDPGKYDEYLNDDNHAIEEAFIYMRGHNAGVDSSHNVYQRDILSVGFSDYTNDNYYPAPGSLLLDGGTSLLNQGLDFDFDYNPRPQGPAFDIGAFESRVMTDKKEAAFVSLFQNYPNPGHHSTTIRYALPEPSEIKLYLVDSTGVPIRVLDSGYKDRGYHQIQLNLDSLDTQFVIYVLEAGNKIFAKKLLILND